MRLLREITHSTSGDGNEFNDPGISCHKRKHGSYQKLLGLGQKDSEVNRKSLLLAKGGTI